MADAAQTTTEKLWTPANVVTLLRICGIPVFVIAMISPWPSWLPGLGDAEVWKEWIAAGIFILLAATDALDGYLARSRGEITNFGKFMDPLADKMLVAAALLALIELSVLPSWVALVILCREFIVSGIRMVAASQGVVIAASWYGKLKTVFQIIALVLFIIKDNTALHDFSDVLSDKLYLISWAVMIIALVLTVVSMLDYFSKARHILGFSSDKLERKLPVEESQDEKLLDNHEDKTAFTEDTDEQNEKILACIRASADATLREARAKNLTIGTAESCTGGLIIGALTSIAGSSDVVLGGIVSYSDEIKHQELGVSNSTLKEFGAVSEETAIEMARGAKKELGVDVAVSVTGVAGPGGGSDDKPVGTVWIGIANEAGEFARSYHFEGDRSAVRQQTVVESLSMLREIGI